MKAFLCTLVMVAGLALTGAAQRNASYHQITGRVVEVNDMHIVVETGKQRLDLERAGWGKCDREPSAGDTVTVHYMLTHARNGDPMYVAETIEVKAAAGSNKK